jgi:hypothetical protein
MSGNAFTVRILLALAWKYTERRIEFAEREMGRRYA